MEEGGGLKGEIGGSYNIINSKNVFLKSWQD